MLRQLLDCGMLVPSSLDYKYLSYAYCTSIMQLEMFYSETNIGTFRTSV
jgi:hypothetical protein